MLHLVLEERGELHIDPQEGLDPAMMVADLFRDGPIHIRVFKVREENRVREQFSLIYDLKKLQIYFFLT